MMHDTDMYYFVELFKNTIIIKERPSYLQRLQTRKASIFFNDENDSMINHINIPATSGLPHYMMCWERPSLFVSCPLDRMKITSI